MNIGKVSDFNWLTKLGIIKIDENNSKYFNTETKKFFGSQIIYLLIVLNVMLNFQRF